MEILFFGLLLMYSKIFFMLGIEIMLARPNAVTRSFNCEDGFDRLQCQTVFVRLISGTGESLHTITLSRVIVPACSLAIGRLK